MESVTRFKKYRWVNSQLFKRYHSGDYTLYTRCWPWSFIHRWRYLMTPEEQFAWFLVVILSVAAIVFIWKAL